MKKEDKVLNIEKLENLLNEYAHFYVTDIAGLNAEATSNLRRKSFGKEVKLVMVKNKLFCKALEKKGIDYCPIATAFKGTSAIMFCNTGNVPAKLIKEVNGPKDEIVKLKGAYVEECFYGADSLEALVAVKSKNELLAEVIALLQSPAKNVISALQSGQNTIHGVLKTLGERAE
ncbi:MAG: 50S ribosomal protein L10 [Bacteroidales bacterium]|jgi:large subunit ribosomal protein L10|nr:50S ribosomal protein L10 [Bacteroidales bacterium]